MLRAVNASRLNPKKKFVTWLEGLHKEAVGVATSRDRPKPNAPPQILFPTVGADPPMENVRWSRPAKSFGATFSVRDARLYTNLRPSCAPEVVG